jgi:DNA-binding response OmpR family regulator
MNATIPDRNPKALLLDDDATALRLLGTALEARGFEVRAATEGEGGLALLLDELLDLDVLVLDLELPGRDGYELLNLVRRAGGERDLGIVVLASAPDRAVRDQLLALGADAVVDRRAGHAVAVAAISAIARRTAAPAPRRLAATALEGALLVARAALAPASRLAPAAA